MIKGLIFDLDGTLVDSLEDLAIATNQVLENHHLPIHDISMYNQFVGNGVKKLMERALGAKHQHLLEECLVEFSTLYENCCLEHTKPYPGIKELIDSLYNDGYRLSVVTNKPHHLAIQIVESLFPNQFVSIFGQQDLYPVKPNPQSTYLALMAMKLSKDDCVFIGDSDVDIETGENAQMDTIGVCWGFRGEQELKNAGATYIVAYPNEIKEILCYDRSK